MPGKRGNDGGGDHEGANGAAPPARARAAFAPEEVAELAASFVRFVLSKYKIELDFAPETLGVLDHYLRDARGELAGTGGPASPQSPPNPGALDLVAATAGAYFGEVVRRAYDSEWRLRDGHEHWLLCMTTVYLAFNPIGMAQEALVMQEAPGWHAHLILDDAEREEVEARLSALPEAAPEEYYALSTRWDVIEIAVSALRARAIAAGLADVRFSTDDYDDD